MKKAKLNKSAIKEEIDIQDSYSLKKFILILIVLTIVFVTFYFITFLVVKPKNNNLSNSTAVIDSQMITMNHLLDRKENEYYVLATKASLYSGYSQVNYQELYNKYISNYLKNENSLKFYKINLDDALNKIYLSDETNIDNNLENLKLSDEVLFKISNKKIDKAFVGSKEILEELSNL